MRKQLSTGTVKLFWDNKIQHQRMYLTTRQRKQIIEDWIQTTKHLKHQYFIIIAPDLKMDGKAEKSLQSLQTNK